MSSRKAPAVWYLYRRYLQNRFAQILDRSEFSMTVLHASGSCLCGVITFTVAWPSKWVAHCHCTRCQRAHGAAFVTWVGMHEDCVKLLDTGNALRWYLAETGASRGFCATCGSPMLFKSPAYPGELHIARALFTNPVDREPGSNAFIRERAAWAQHIASLPDDTETP